MSCLPDGDGYGDGWPELPGGGGGGDGDGDGKSPPIDCPPPKLQQGSVCVCPSGMKSDGDGGCRDMSCAEKYSACTHAATNERVFCRQANLVQALTNCGDGRNPDGSYVPTTRNRNWCGFRGSAFSYCVFQWMHGIPICTEGGTDVTVNVGVLGLGHTPGTVEQPFNPYVGSNARCEANFRSDTAACSRGFMTCTGAPAEPARPGPAMDGVLR